MLGIPQWPEDAQLLLRALEERGVSAEPAVWDDPGQAWSRFGLVIVRATWDYVPRREAFLKWTCAVPSLLNRPEVVAWNTDKRYLRELPAAVPTQFISWI